MVISSNRLSMGCVLFEFRNKLLVRRSESERVVPERTGVWIEPNPHNQNHQVIAQI